MTEKVVTLPYVAPSEYTNTSRVIHKGPCIVKAVHVNFTGTTTGSCKVYDGVNDKGTLKAWITVSSRPPYTWRPGEGTDFDYGIYLDLDAQVMATVTYIPESRKAFI